MAQIDAFKQAALSQGYSPEEIDSFVKLAESQPKPQKTFVSAPMDNGFSSVGVEDESKQMSRYVSPQEQTDVFGTQGSVLPSKFQITQPFGNRSRVEKFSGGVNLGTDFAVPQDTPLSVPPGEWEVITASNGFNQGSGNFVKVRNTKTGESIGFEHLNRIGVQPGSIIKSGTVVGLSGNTGNSTGPHASIPYQNEQGQYQDILSSPYARWIYGR